VRAELTDHGEHISRKRIARLMRHAGLRGFVLTPGATPTVDPRRIW
jgi:hypothetical protein